MADRPPSPTQQTKNRQGPTTTAVCHPTPRCTQAPAPKRPPKGKLGGAARAAYTCRSSSVMCSARDQAPPLSFSPLQPPLPFLSLPPPSCNEGPAAQQGRAFGASLTALRRSLRAFERGHTLFRWLPLFALSLSSPLSLPLSFFRHAGLTRSPRASDPPPVPTARTGGKPEGKAQQSSFSSFGSDAGRRHHRPSLFLSFSLSHFFPHIFIHTHIRTHTHTPARAPLSPPRSTTCEAEELRTPDEKTPYSERC